MKKTIFTLIVMIFSLNFITGQNGRFDNLRLKNPDLAATTDSLISRKANGKITKTTITVQQLLDLINAGFVNLYTADGNIPLNVDREISLLGGASFNITGIGNTNVAVDNTDLEFSADNVSFESSDGNGINASLGLPTTVRGDNELHFILGTGGNSVNPNVAQSLVSTNTGNGNVVWGDNSPYISGYSQGVGVSSNVLNIGKGVGKLTLTNGSNAVIGIDGVDFTNQSNFSSPFYYFEATVILPDGTHRYIALDSNTDATNGTIANIYAEIGYNGPSIGSNWDGPNGDYEYYPYFISTTNPSGDIEISQINGYNNYVSSGLLFASIVEGSELDIRSNTSNSFIGGQQQQLKGPISRSMIFANGLHTAATSNITNSAFFGSYQVLEDAIDVTAQSSLFYGNSPIFNTTPSGTFISQSLVGGNGNQAAGNNQNTIVSGQGNLFSDAISGIISGQGNILRGRGETVLGLFGTDYVANSTGILIDQTDRAFNIGNGISASSRSDALTIFKDGRIIAPSLSDALVTAGGGSSLITLDYFNNNLPAGGGAQSLQDIHDGSDGTGNFADDLYVENTDGSGFLNIGLQDTNTNSYFNYTSEGTFNVDTRISTIRATQNASMFVDAGGDIFADILASATGDIRLTSDYTGTTQNQINLDENFLRLQRKGSGSSSISNRLDIADPNGSSTAIHQVIVPAPNISSLTTHYVPLNFTDGSTTVTANNEGLVDMSTLNLGGGATPTLQDITTSGNSSLNNIVMDESTLITQTSAVGGTAFSQYTQNDEGNSFSSGINGSSNYVIGAGPGISSERLVISQDGIITAPNTSIADVNSGGTNALITREYADANYLGGGGGLNNIIEDTTPQLGAVLDTQGFALSAPASQSIIIDSDDSSISAAFRITINGLTSGEDIFFANELNSFNLGNPQYFNGGNVTVEGGTNTQGAIFHLENGAAESANVNRYTFHADDDLILEAAGNEVMRISSTTTDVSFSESITVGGTITTNSFTVATLPTGQTGMIAYVTDGASVSYRGVATGGGSENVLVFFNGTNWIYH